MKKQEDTYVMEFIKAICPDAPNLYLASFNERVCLEDAAKLIGDLRANLAAANERADKAEHAEEVARNLLEMRRRPGRQPIRRAMILALLLLWDWFSIPANWMVALGLSVQWAMFSHFLYSIVGIVWVGRVCYLHWERNYTR
jgi:hypothetical protein